MGYDDYKDEILENEEYEELDNIITLNDEDGNEINFEFLDLIEYEGNEYVVLLPADDEDATEVLILQVAEGTDDIEEYIGIEDEELLQTLFNIFREKFKEEFNFE